jgi:hypothetical protein
MLLADVDLVIIRRRGLRPTSLLPACLNKNTWRIKIRRLLIGWLVKFC